MAKKAAPPPAPSLQALRRQRRPPAWTWPQLARAAAAPLAALALAAAARPAWRRWRAPSAFREVRAVPRLLAGSPGALASFFELYHGRQPVVIEGALDGWPAMNWSASSLAAACPSAQLPVYEYDLQAQDWAALKEAGVVPLSEYLRGDFGRGEASGHAARYGLEMSLRNECPSLLEDVRIPAFFTDDLLVRYYKKGAWPTLIAGPSGTRSGLHRDTHNLPFWMALFVGRKRWRIFAADEPALRTLFMEDRNGFSFDPFDPDFVQLPGLAEASVYEHVLEAGQLLYIPNGAPHAAYNVKDTIAISGNYLDPRSLERHAKVTCNTTLWRDSRLCWFYDEDFARHSPAALPELRELSYFQFAGFSGPAAWCAEFLPFVREKSEKRSLRYLPIVEEYCSAKMQQLPK